jgi:hypothetical protein
MKTILSLAILALLGDISARHLHRLSAAQLDSSLKHRVHQSKRVSHRAGLDRNLYPPTKKGHKWWELDDSTERLHGTRPEDNFSPYDPDVVDAPEDIKRVGNDHTPLHNAKLAPKGYYTGFFHKDYKGMYAQKHSRKHRKDQELVQYDHEFDTDDIPDGQDPVLAQRGSAAEKMQEQKEWEDYFQAAGRAAKEEQDAINMDNVYQQEEDEMSYEFVQYDHENDTEDIPEGQDPIQFSQRNGRLTRFKTEEQLAQEKEDMRLQEQADEVQAIMDEQASEDASQVQLAAEIPHEDDTEDLVSELGPSQYDHKHSKAWNEMVQKKALEYENQMQIEENMKISQKKAQEEAKERAIQEKRRKEQEAKKKAEESRAQRVKAGKATIDLSEIYSNLPSEDYMQLSEHTHHRHFPSHNEYDTVTLQTGYENHSQNFKDRVAEESAQLEKEMEQEEKREKSLAQAVVRNGMRVATGVDGERRNINPSVDLAEMYGGMSDLVQIGFNHDDDEDDIVAELNDPVRAQVAESEHKPVKRDFMGSEFTEVYDD